MVLFWLWIEMGSRIEMGTGGNEGLYILFREGESTGLHSFQLLKLKTDHPRRGGLMS